MIRQFCIIAAVILCCATAQAAGPLSILGYTKSTSFWMELPDGWRSDTAAAKQTGAIFVLLPAGFTFDTAPAAIIASAYHNSSLAIAMQKDQASFAKNDADIAVKNEKAILSKSNAKFSVREFRSQRLTQQGYEAVAYHEQAPDVVVVTLSAQTEAHFDNAMKTFVGFLATYETSKLKVERH